MQQNKSSSQQIPSSKDTNKKDKEKGGSTNKDSEKLNKPKVEKLCWFGKKCHRRDCKFNHEEKASGDNRDNRRRNNRYRRIENDNPGKQKPETTPPRKFNHEGKDDDNRRRKERYSKSEYGNQEKKKPETTTTPTQHNQKNETDHFLEETVAQIAGMIFNVIQQKMGDVRPLKRNPDHSTRGRPNY